MNNPATPLLDAATAVAEACAHAETVDALSRRELVAANAAVGVLRRHVDALQALLAAEIARESRTELGSGSLSKEQGFRNETQFIAATTGISTGDARRLVRVGEAIAPRVGLDGAPKPAKWPRVQQAMESGKLSAPAPAAAAIVTFLDNVPPRVDKANCTRAEGHLVEQAPGMTMEQLSALIARTEGWLIPEALPVKLAELRQKRFLHISEREGMIRVNGQFDPESGAPVLVALNGYVTAQFQAREKAVKAGAVDDDHRTVEMMRADGLTLFAEHMLGCTNTTSLLAGAQVVVRIEAKDLMDGTGTAEIDGIAQPVDPGAARRLAASGKVLPWVCGGGSEIIDYGRSLRLFTPAQKLLLAERDGGCAMCNLPPSMAKAHHLYWWYRDTGKTDLEEGVLLCTSCHHRVHDNGWEIFIEGTGVTAKVWFIPPANVDPNRTPILGGRARFGPPRETLVITETTSDSSHALPSGSGAPSSTSRVPSIAPV